MKTNIKFSSIFYPLIDGQEEVANQSLGNLL